MMLALSIVASLAVIRASDDDATWVASYLERNLNLTEPMSDAELTRAVHRAATVLMTNSTKPKLLWALAKGSEALRRSNDKHVEDYLSQLANETLYESNGTETELLERWRRKGPATIPSEIYARAELAFRKDAGEALRSQYALRGRTVFDAYLTNDLKDDAREDAVFDEAIRRATEATKTAILKMRRLKNETRDVYFETYATEVAEAVRKAATQHWHSRNRDLVAIVKAQVLKDAEDALNQCLLTETSILAKFGMHTESTSKVCEAEASIRWFELEEVRPLLTQFRAMRRDDAKIRLRQFKDDGTSALDVVKKQLNVSIDALRHHFDKAGCDASISEDADKCAAQANSAIDSVVQKAAKAAAHVVNLDPEDSAILADITATVVEPAAKGLRDLVATWHDDVAARQDKASADCARDALQKLELLNDRAQRRAHDAVAHSFPLVLLRYYVDNDPQEPALTTDPPCGGGGVHGDDYSRQRTNLLDADRRYRRRVDQARTDAKSSLTLVAFFDVALVAFCGPIGCRRNIAVTAPGLALFLCLFILSALAVAELIAFLSIAHSSSLTTGVPSPAPVTVHLVVTKVLGGEGHILALVLAILSHCLSCCCCLCRSHRRSSSSRKKKYDDDHVL